MTTPNDRLAMNLDKRNYFAFNAGQILTPLVNKSVTRVLGKPDGESPFEHRGTALLCNIDGHQAVVTANHVLVEMEKEERFTNISLSCTAKRWSSTIHRFPEIDVAVFLPDAPLVLNTEKRFWPADVSDESADLLATDYVMLHGYPARFSRFSALGPAYISQAYTHCTSIRPKASDFPEEARALIKEQVPDYPLIPDGILKPFQFALNYAEHTGPLKTVEGEEVTNTSIVADHSPLYYDGPFFPGQKPWGAFGLSGSPVWRFGAHESEWTYEKWSPQRARLAGIVTHWNESHKILVVTPFAEVLRHLHRAR